MERNNKGQFKKGSKPHNYKGGKRIAQNGYIEIRVNNPNRKKPYVYEHRLVMEQHLGRKLKTSEHVHHINGNKIDNRIENLELIGNAAHQKKYPHKRNELGRFKAKAV